MSQCDAGVIVHMHLFAAAAAGHIFIISVLPDAVMPVEVDSFTKPYRQEGILRNPVDCVSVNCPSASVRI